MAVKELTSADFEQAVKGNEIALFDFFATWCGPCKAFSPIFDKVADENPDIFFGKLDIDKNQELANAANVQAVPTLMIVKKGHVIYQEAGALREADLNDLIGQAKALDVEAALAAAKAAGTDQDELIEEHDA